MRRELILSLASLAIIGAAALASTPSSQGGAASLADGEPVLLELFTSQGCSSCPPADRLAVRLAREPGVIVVSRPVTYWDRLGWKDTLAKEENTQLQRQYARRGLAGRNGVYTPQLVIDGTFGVVGSQEHAIRQLISQARVGDTAAIRVKRLDSRDWVVGLGGQTAETAELVVLSVASPKDVAIARGENAGRKITYINVLREDRRIATWNGGAKQVRIAEESLPSPKTTRHALVLREPEAGAVLASAWLD